MHCCLVFGVAVQSCTWHLIFAQGGCTITTSSQVALQRRLFEEYEKREMVRKIQELREVCPQISEAAAARALELCNGRCGKSGQDHGTSSCRINPDGCHHRPHPLWSPSFPPSLTHPPSLRSEDEAAAELVGNPAFRSRVMGPAHGSSAPSTAGQKSQQPWAAKPDPAVRPKLVDPGSLNHSVGGAWWRKTIRRTQAC